MPGMLYIFRVTVCMSQKALFVFVLSFSSFVALVHVVHLVVTCSVHRSGRFRNITVHSVIERGQFRQPSNSAMVETTRTDPPNRGKRSWVRVRV